MKVNKSLVLLLAILVIATFWYIEKTKWIPQYAIVLYKMGLSCDDECGQDKQLQYFQRAVRYGPKLNDPYYNNILSDAHYRSALIYEKIGNDAKVVDSFVKAIAFNQKNAQAYHEMGIYYFQKRAYERALRSFLRLWSIKAQVKLYKSTLYYIAQIYDKRKEYNSAIKYYHSFVGNYPEYAAKVYPRVIEIYRLLNDTDALAEKIFILRRENSGSLSEQLDRAFKASQASEASSRETELNLEFE